MYRKFKNIASLRAYNGWGVKNDTKFESSFQPIDTRFMHGLDINRELVY